MSNKNTGSDLLPHKHNECYQCENRQVGCHSHCKSYLAFRDQKIAEAERRKKEHDEHDDFMAVFANRQKDNRRRIKDKRR